MTEVANIAEEHFKEMFAPAELHPGLVPYLGELPSGMKALRHPLIYGIPYLSQTNNWYNKQYEFAKAEVKRALAAGDPWAYLVMHERPYRMEALQTYLSRKRVSNKVYWELLSWAWEDSENIWQNKEQWIDLLRSDRAGCRHFMDAEERKFFAELPDRFDVYRGYSSRGDGGGISWTLSKDKAAWFAKRLAPGVRRVR